MRILEDEGVDTRAFNSKGTSILEALHDDLAGKWVSSS